MSKKILLVEDDLPVRELYEYVLNNAGFQVTAAVDGEEGLRFAQDDKPDLILLDIMLPKIDGVEVLRRLKEYEVTKEVPVILLTNLGQEDIIKKAFEIGAEKYLIKAQHQPKEIVEEVEMFLADRISD